MAAQPCPLRVRVALIATVAAGGGDVAFSVNMVAALTACDRLDLVAVAVVVQAGGDREEVDHVLSVITPTLPHACCVCGGVRDARRLAGGDDTVTVTHGWTLASSPHRTAIATATATATSGTVACVVDASGRLAADGPHVMIQGPLLLFKDAAWGMSQLGWRPEGVTSAHPLLLTVREFGQSPFCCGGVAGGSTITCPPPPWTVGDAVTSRFTSSTPVHHLDVSAGLGAGEWGIFHHFIAAAASSTAPLRVPAALAPPHMVAYIRSTRHLRCLPRWTALWWWGQGLGGDVGAHVQHWHVWLNDTPLVTPTEGAAAATAHTSPPPALAMMMDSLVGGLSELTARAASCTVTSLTMGEGPATPHQMVMDCSIAPPHADGDAVEPRRLTVVIHDHGGHRLPMAEFQHLLATATATAVTGDASLNEAIVACVPFVYCDPPHKVHVAADLKRRRARVGLASCVEGPQTWVDGAWAFVMGQPGAASAMVSCAGGDGSAWDRIAHAYRDWCRHNLLTPGSDLGANVAVAACAMAETLTAR